eukprot:6080733-Karenia_brevis.AAC.1
MAQHTADNPSAILIPAEWWGHVRWMDSLCMHSMVLIGCYGFISSYLPDISKPCSEFSLALDSLREACTLLRAKGATALVVGGDFQLELQPSMGRVTGPQALGRSSC